MISSLYLFESHGFIW